VGRSAARLGAIRLAPLRRSNGPLRLYALSLRESRISFEPAERFSPADANTPELSLTHAQAPTCLRAFARTQFALVVAGRGQAIEDSGRP
jgi:hypothetical protein